MRRVCAAARRAARGYATEANARLSRGEELMQWCRLKGASEAGLVGVDLAESAQTGGGLGLRATRSMRPFALAAAVPTTCVLGAGAATGDATYKPFADELRAICARGGLAGQQGLPDLLGLYHLAHLIASERSDWAPYLRILPQGDELREATTADWRPVPRRSQAGRSSELDEFAADVLGHSLATFSECCDMANAVYHSRGIRLPEGCLEAEDLARGTGLAGLGGVLIPLFDMVNGAKGGAESNVAVLAVANPLLNAEQHRLWLAQKGIDFSAGVQMCLVTTREVEKGEELLLNYSAVCLIAQD
eukprot:Hpha_TRINITY_DN23255_c0_g1::TRINITY_DN23255_c0_g1_i1::g.30204::m.30204